MVLICKVLRCYAYSCLTIVSCSINVVHYHTVVSHLDFIFVNCQLKKEGRRNEYEMHKLLALNQRQKMVSWSCLGWYGLPSSREILPTFFYHVLGFATRNRRSFYGYKTAKRAFRMSKGFLTWNFRLGDILHHAVHFFPPIDYNFLTSNLLYAGAGNGNGPRIQVFILCNEDCSVYALTSKWYGGI